MQQQAQARSYTLDRQAAINGSTAGHQRITSTGAYQGVITKAKSVRASTESEGVEITFESDTSAEARYLTIWTHSKNGERLFGLNLLCALMTCIKVREIAPEATTIKEWHPPSSAEVDTLVQLYPGIMNRPVGVLLVREQFRKTDGSIGERMRLAGFFESNTRRSAREILADTPPAEASDIAAAEAALTDKLLPDAGHSATPAPVATASVANGAAFDDDIPF